MSGEQLDKLLPPQEEVAKMPYVGCDWCDRSRLLDIQWNSAYPPPGDIVRGVFVCSECDRSSPFALRESTITFKPGRQRITPLNAGVPKRVEEFYVEAELCLYAVAYRAAAAMARATVEQVLEEAGLTDRTLDDRINRARDQEIIGQEEHTLAHGSRLVGNDALHEAETISAGEVSAALSVAARIVNHIFK